LLVATIKTAIGRMFARRRCAGRRWKRVSFSSGSYSPSAQKQLAVSPPSTTS